MNHERRYLLLFYSKECAKIVLRHIIQEKHFNNNKKNNINIHTSPLKKLWCIVINALDTWMNGATQNCFCVIICSSNSAELLEMRSKEAWPIYQCGGQSPAGDLLEKDFYNLPKIFLLRPFRFLVVSERYNSFFSLSIRELVTQLSAIESSALGFPAPAQAAYLFLLIWGGSFNLNERNGTCTPIKLKKR